ncbi:MAG: hypothetical protein WKF62_07130, partial [Solirubrobacterales bacterium]
MENRKLPALIALVGVVIAIVVFLFVVNDDTADGPTETTSSEQTERPEGSQGPEVPVIEIVEGQPVAGVAELTVTKGAGINFIVESDAAHEVHLHTYDVTMDVPAG